jgi:hypothetical protein
MENNSNNNNNNKPIAAQHLGSEDETLLVKIIGGSILFVLVAIVLWPISLPILWLIIDYEHMTLERVFKVMMWTLLLIGVWIFRTVTEAAIAEKPKNNTLLTKSDEIDSCKQAIKFDLGEIVASKLQIKAINQRIDSFHLLAATDLKEKIEESKKGLLSFLFTAPVLLLMFIHFKVVFLLIVKAVTEIMKAVGLADDNGTFGPSLNKLFTETFGSIHDYYLYYTNSEVFFIIMILVLCIWTTTVLYRDLRSLKKTTVENHIGHEVAALNQNKDYWSSVITECENRIKVRRADLKSAKSELKILKKT